MNSFCLECCGGDWKEVQHCDDYYCAFYRDRWMNMDWQQKKIDEKNKKKKEKFAVRFIHSYWDSLSLTRRNMGFIGHAKTKR